MGGVSMRVVRGGGDTAVVQFSPVNISLSLFNKFLGGALVMREGRLVSEDTLRIVLLPASAYIEGEAKVAGTRLFIPFTGVEYAISAKLSGDGDGFLIDGYAIDPHSNKALLQGEVKVLGVPRYSLTASAMRLALLNTTLSQNNLIAGRVNASAVLRLEGSTSELRIELLRAKPAEKSVLELPIYTGAYVYEVGFVEFVKRDTSRQGEEYVSSIEQTREGGGFAVTFACNAQIDENLTVRVLFDPPGGDVLTVRGVGNQQIYIDAEGYPAITGRFEIKSGEYKFNFKNLFVRTFKIDRGDIVWSGDPYSALLNVSAYHETRPATRSIKEAYGIVGGGGSDYATVWVRMNMTGTLSKPEITFYLESPDVVSDPSLASLLNQINSNEQERNLQAFSLLTTGQFARPLYASWAGGENPSGVYHSVSEFVSQQLNMLASEVLGDPLLQVAVRYQSEKQQDISGEGVASRRQREFQLALSRSFLQERLQIGIESQVVVGGERATSRVPTGTMQVEYALTKDGSVRWRVYSQSYRDAFFEQNRYRTGMGIRFTKSFDRWRELLFR